MEITTRTDAFWYIRSDIPVTVLSETLPEEPITFGARVTAGGLRFVRGYDADWPWIDSLDGELYDWVHLCEMGPVTVIPDQGWEVPVESPKVPELIEEWPDNDEHLREFSWVDTEACIWTYDDHDQWWGYRKQIGSKWVGVSGHPSKGPWKRIYIPHDIR